MKFNLTAKLTVTAYTVIEADTIEEAIEKANNRYDMMSITSNNADTPEDVWMIDELDGMPYEIEEE